MFNTKWVYWKSLHAHDTMYYENSDVQREMKEKVIRL